VGDNTKPRRGTVEMNGRRELDVHASGQVTSGCFRQCIPICLTTGTLTFRAAPLDSERARCFREVTVTQGGVCALGQPALG